MSGLGDTKVNLADLVLIANQHFEDTDQHHGAEHDDESDDQQTERPAAGWGSVAEAPT